MCEDLSSRFATSEANKHIIVGGEIAQLRARHAGGTLRLLGSQTQSKSLVVMEEG